MKKNTAKLPKNIFSQIKNNAVALISLFIAISSLSYNTWRNEQTEFNRNQRHAGFEVLVTLNKLQQVVFHHYYDQDTTNKGNIRTGWMHILTINDFSKLLNNEIMSASLNLHKRWENSWANLTSDIDSVNAVIKEIDNVREQTLITLEQLE